MTQGSFDVAVFDTIWKPRDNQSKSPPELCRATTPLAGSQVLPDREASATSSAVLMNSSLVLARNLGSSHESYETPSSSFHFSAKQRSCAAFEGL